MTSGRRSTETNRSTSRAAAADAQAHRRRARTVAAIDHDLRQPMQALGMALRALRTSVKDSATLTGVLAADAAFRDVAALVQDLIDILRFESGDLQPRPQQIRLDTLLETTQAKYIDYARDLGIALRVGRTHLQTRSDRRWLERCLGNLVGNAIRHSGATKVLIGVRRRGDSLTIEVHDNGRGFAPSTLTKAMQAGVNLLQTLGEPGSGLGLSVVQQFMQALGGELNCRSQNGRGTVFQLRLRGPCDWCRSELRGLRNEGKPLQGKLVAVLDDQLSVVESTQATLESLGAVVISHTDELAFLQEVTLLDRTPDLFVLDFSLRSGNVLRVVRILRSRLIDNPPRIIVVTAHANDLELLGLAKTTPVLHKPLTDPAFQLIVGILQGTMALAPTD